MRISDWSSDVCSSDLSTCNPITGDPYYEFLPAGENRAFHRRVNLYAAARALGFDIDYKSLLELFSSKGRLVRAYYYTALMEDQEYQIGRASCRERVCQYVYISVVAV